jgi:glutathione-regulated potassium-efflux system ancillary protein KefG
MSRVLVLFAHPAVEKSRVHIKLMKHIPAHQGITFHDLYELYPDFQIDVDQEQKLMENHDIIVLQHPIYWYSAPAIVKQWLDLVLEHGWAYGSSGFALKGKVMMSAISCGGALETYTETGRNKKKIPEFLFPFEFTARLCNMDYWPPFVIHGTHKLSDTDMLLHALQFEQMLLALAGDRISPDERKSCTYMNELFPIPKTIQS